LSAATPIREQREGGYSSASRWIVERPDGVRAFVKAKAPPSPERATGAVAEALVSGGIDAHMVPVLLDYHFGGDDTPTVLAFEDLSAARWGTPITEADARALRAALDELADIAAPGGIEPLRPHETHGAGWAHVPPLADVAAQLGLWPGDWLERSLPTLAAAAATVSTAGSSLVHDDLWLQNWCRAERGAVLVDWAGAALGNARLNHAWGEAGIRAAGGPHGRLVAPDDADHDGWAAYMAGLATSYVLCYVEHAEAMPRLHATQAREAMACLEWACEALAIEPPDFAPSLLAHGPWQP
jgi:hypothetical protein